jgi:hypothetical protein
VSDTFCCFGMLTGREALDRLAEVLPEKRREALRACMQHSGDASREEWIGRLGDIRRAEAEQFGGIPGWEGAAPPVRRWLLARRGAIWTRRS